MAALEERVAALEFGRAAVACASGMAAEAMVLETLQQGDHLIAASALYGGTVTMLSVNLARFGISTAFVDATHPQAFADAIRPDTRAIFAESLGNPSLVMLDIEAVAEVAHAHGIPLIIHNTVPSPYPCSPLALGADIVVHSATKYLGGHGTTLAGVVVDGGKFPWDNGKFPGMTESSPGYHGVKFYETFWRLRFCDALPRRAPARPGCGAVTDGRLADPARRLNIATAHGPAQPQRARGGAPPASPPGRSLGQLSRPG